METDFHRLFLAQVGEEFAAVLIAFLPAPGVPGAALQRLDSDAIVGDDAAAGKDIASKVVFLDHLRIALVAEADMLVAHLVANAAVRARNMVIKDYLGLLVHVLPDRPFEIRRSGNKPALAAVFVSPEALEKELQGIRLFLAGLTWPLIDLVAKQIPGRNITE